MPGSDSGRGTPPNAPGDCFLGLHTLLIDLLLERGGLALGEELLAGELGRTLQRRDRREVPGALEIRITPRGTRWCLSDRGYLNERHDRDQDLCM